MEMIVNRETEKLELHFSREEYMALSESDQAEIKSNFLFSRRAGAWVSRAKWPNTYRAEAVAKRLGAVDGGSDGEALSFAEKQERKAERAQARAERYEGYAENAERRGEALQKPINDMHGDIAFFTQPNINSAGGRAFTRRRDRMFAAYDRGMEELKKSEYFRDRAETARETAASTLPKNKGFCQRRIKEAQKEIRDGRKLLEEYDAKIARINAGETVKRYDGSIITVEDVENWIERQEARVEAAMSKELYYTEALESLGGVPWSKENLHKGDVVTIEHYGKVRFVRGGSVNFTYEFLQPHMKYADGRPMQGQAAYAEITDPAPAVS